MWVLLSSSSAIGSFNKFTLNSDIQNHSDKNGPEINAFLNDKSYVDGDIIQQNPVLNIQLYDSLGINSTDVGIGKYISLRIDSGAPINLNEYYQPETNSYQAGNITYSLLNIASGLHRIHIKAYDIADNKTEISLEFEISDDIKPKIERLYNYPNPFTENTNFYFTQNMTNVNYEVHIKIFTVSGKLVKTITTETTCTSKLSNPISWDGLDDFGNSLGRGVYVYQLTIKSTSGKKSNATEKLVLLQ